MDRLIIIISAVVIAIALDWAIEFLLIIRRNRFKEKLEINRWIHPNAICVWRVLLAFVGLAFCFIIGWYFLGITLYAISAFMDRIDGIIARDFNKVTKVGEWLDPLADKLTYLPPLLIFAYIGYISIPLTWMLILVEGFGQIGRRLISRSGKSIQANYFGKTKAVICFALVIYCFLLDDGLNIINFGNQIVLICIILSVLSFAAKTIPYNWYIYIKFFPE